MKIKLRSYQVEGVRKMVQTKRMILADDPGAGKTLQALSAIAHYKALPVIVFCTRGALGTWRDEVAKWLGPTFKVMIYRGTPAQRKKQLKSMHKYHFVVTTFAMAKEVAALNRNWACLITDEGHLAGMLNRKTNICKHLKPIARKCKLAYFLDGTPVKKGPHDLWPMLNLIDHRKFSSFWKYVNEYCVVDATPFGRSILGKPSDVKKFQAMLRQHFLRRRKEVVDKELPPKVRQRIRVEMTHQQTKMYRQMEEEMFLNYGDNFIVSPNAAVNCMRLRQLLVTPRMLGIPEDGGALLCLKEQVQEELDANHAVIVFTPFRLAIPYIVEALEPYADVIEQIHGQIKDLPRDVANRFQEAPTKRKVLVCTIKAGASWEAFEASTVFFLGMEWTPDDIIQAESRAHRSGQTKTVTCKYIIHEDTIDEDVLRLVTKKDIFSMITMGDKT